MKLMNQQDVYESVGRKIKTDLYEGNAVVLFAYGLSGSGKTFTVFGPDAVDIPEVRVVDYTITYQQHFSVVYLLIEAIERGDGCRATPGTLHYLYNRMVVLYVT